jgi:hypothetical protein
MRAELRVLFPRTEGAIVGMLWKVQWVVCSMGSAMVWRGRSGRHTNVNRKRDRRDALSSPNAA